MIKSKKNKKKKGFTLVELIAVIAIIGILAAILVPSINGYISKAKRTKVIEQARTFSMAVETIAQEKNMTNAQKVAVKPSTVTDAMKELIVGDSGKAVTEVLALLNDCTYAEAIKVVNGSEFKLDANSKLDIGTIGS